MAKSKNHTEYYNKKEKHPKNNTIEHTKLLKFRKESHRRTLFKTVCWRVIASVTTMLIVFAFTGKVIISLGVGFVEAIMKLLLYYLHERIWGKISWGKPKYPLDDLPVSKELLPEDKEIIRKHLQDLGYLD